MNVFKRTRYGWIEPVAALLLATASPGMAGKITYPAIGNLDLRQGTIELWLTPTVDLRPPNPGQYQAVLTLFQLKVRGEFEMSAGMYARQEEKGVGAHLFVSMNSEVGKRAMLGMGGGPPIDWRRGELHHVAFTWDGTRMTFWADGKQIGRREQTIGFTGALAGRGLIIGNSWGRDAGYTLHAVRVSCTAHDAEELKDAKPAARIDTLMLDRFNRTTIIDKNGQTHAEVIAGLTGETGGRVSGSHHAVTSPKPGLSLNGGK
jgi:hypothetical protein